MKLLTTPSKNTKIFISIAVLYLLFSFVLPAASIIQGDRHGTTYHVTLFLTRLPFVALWIAMFYAYRTLHSYVEVIKDSPEGRDFSIINHGLGWMAWGLAIPATVAALITSLAVIDPHYRIAALITVNYMYVIVSLVAFASIFSGILRYVRHAKIDFTSRQILATIFCLVLFCVSFCFIIALRLHSQRAGDSLNSYFLPNIVIWLTILTPYLFAWTVGFLAALQLLVLSQKTRGVIYRQGLILLASGLIMVILAMSALQYFRSIIPRNGILQVNAVLFTTYAIYALQALGASFVIRGTRRLKKIEEA